MGKSGIWIKRLVMLSLFGVLGGALLFAFLPQPVQVEVVQVDRAPLEVAVRDDGRTRVRERYLVSSPIAGQLRRVELEVGDEVQAGQTVIARLVPTIPAFLDPRDQARVEARVSAAQSRLRRAEADLRRAGDELEQARIDLDRSKHLRESGASTDAHLEQAQLTFRKQTESLNAAEFLKDVAQFELEQEQAALVQMTREPGDEATQADFEIRSPVNGRVLKLMQESSAVVTPGMPVLEVGDPHELEVIADILSIDAVKIRPGQKARFVHWGGTKSLAGVVQTVEPSGFTKISALGVEEQRVNVIFDFVGSASEYETLGDGYRVEVEVVVWDEQDTLQVPTAALFRSGSDWAVFVAKDGRAVLRKVEIGQNNGVRAQVLGGLESGELVISHPSDDVQNGVMIQARETVH
ncbi:efflux RND transporter periplasmic adaptor subunit [Planctomicrobium piriforme]|uniref:HlyD family secretion protein n=1 Tax=Planctomicrobium piriforme TaxID=1576369 RepID=A0A1I3PUZ9_9PLAN|nr:HlyD family efflux transporter periplasmic adaptor subunit [Planctomicrobium piriforme]SFJ25664.1 HlyD family secretion protein [Planctomicrobium piriforme]